MSETATVLRWSAYEHEYVHRENDWYWALGIVTVSVVVISVLLSDVLFAIIMLAAATTMILHARAPAHLATFEISDRGIRVNDVLHRWGEVISFWVEDEDTERPLLLVDTTKWMSPNLIIPIEHIEPRVVRAYLKERCTETHMYEPWTHKIVEFFGF